MFFWFSGPETCQGKRFLHIPIHGVFVFLGFSGLKNAMFLRRYVGLQGVLAPVAVWDKTSEDQKRTSTETDYLLVTWENPKR